MTTDFKLITSKDNSLIKLVSLLQKSSSARKNNNLFVLEGLRICKDAFENGIRFDKLIVSETALIKYAREINSFLNISEEIFKMPDSLFNKISDTTSPQGIIAICKICYKNNKDILKTGRYVALENVADPSNLGAISRTVEALGASGIILFGNGCDPFSPKALRASMGTLLRIPLFITEDFPNYIKNSELQIFSCVVDKNALPITNAEFKDGCVIIIGNEANGITEQTKKISDNLITIPMTGRAESLNAAAAASISIWEMMK